MTVLDSKSATFWRKRMEAMRRMIDDVDPDVICLQEFMVPVGQYIPEGHRRAGFDFFANVPDAFEASAEASVTSFF